MFVLHMSHEPAARFDPNAFNSRDHYVAAFSSWQTAVSPSHKLCAVAQSCFILHSESHLEGVSSSAVHPEQKLFASCTNFNFWIQVSKKDVFFPFQTSKSAGNNVLQVKSQFGKHSCKRAANLIFLPPAGCLFPKSLQVCNFYASVWIVLSKVGGRLPFCARVFSGGKFGSTGQLLSNSEEIPQERVFRFKST